MGITENLAAYTTPFEIVDASLHVTNFGDVKKRKKKKFAKITKTYKVV